MICWRLDKVLAEDDDFVRFRYFGQSELFFDAQAVSILASYKARIDCTT